MILMLASNDLMSTVSQSQDGAEPVFKALKDLPDGRTMAERLPKCYLGFIASYILVDSSLKRLLGLVSER